MALKFGDVWFKVLKRPKFTSPLVIDCKRLSSYDDIPKSPQFPIVGSLPYFIRSGGQMYLHKYVDNLHKKLGPLFRDTMVGKELLFTSDPDANLQVYRAEGPYPEHYLVDAWTQYLEETGQKRGLFFMDGPEWQKYRQILNRQLLHPKSMENHVKQISSICEDFIDTWKRNPPNEDLEYYLYSWNIECIAAIALGTRLGFLEKLRKDKVKDLKDIKEQEFIKSIHDVFLESATLYSLPVKLAKVLKAASWKRFFYAVSHSLDQGRSYVKRGIEKCSSETNVEIQKCILYKLLKEENVGEENASTLLVDLFLASADTTSHTARWALYLLGKNPEVAQKTRSEICSLLTPKKTLTLTALNDCSYLKGIIKETLRMYPTAPFLTRKLAKETSLCGYSVPAGTMIISSLYTMGRDPNNFTDPNSFRPERWFRDTQNTGKFSGKTSSDFLHTNKKAYVPWGLGGRSCVGKRIAELELSLLLMEALLSFDWTVEEDIEMVLRMVAVPSKDFSLTLKPIAQRTI